MLEVGSYTSWGVFNRTLGPLCPEEHVVCRVSAPQRLYNRQSVVSLSELSLSTADKIWQIKRTLLLFECQDEEASAGVSHKWGDFVPISPEYMMEH